MMEQPNNALEQTPLTTLWKAATCCAMAASCWIAAQLNAGRYAYTEPS